MLVRPPRDYNCGIDKQVGSIHLGRGQALAEVCRNRTDRPDKIGTVGFEVPGGHQPACTSKAMIQSGLSRVNRHRRFKSSEKKRARQPTGSLEGGQSFREWRG